MEATLPTRLLDGGRRIGNGRCLELSKCRRKGASLFCEGASLSTASSRRVSSADSRSDALTLVTVGDVAVVSVTGELAVMTE